MKITIPANFKITKSAQNNKNRNSKEKIDGENTPYKCILSNYKCCFLININVSIFCLNYAFLTMNKYMLFSLYDAQSLDNILPPMSNIGQVKFFRKYDLLL